VNAVKLSVILQQVDIVNTLMGRTLLDYIMPPIM